jgi:glycosyltransferase involved in cell wall biosynthesis
MPRPTTERVAVVVPCFNDGATVEDTVRSATSQNEPVELVVVDDGSTDAATLAALSRMATDGVPILRQENGGLAAARMAGIAATTAPYVLPLDADDLLEPGALRTLADTLDANPEAMLAWGWYTRFGDETTVQPTVPYLDAWHITYQNELPSTALMRRSALEQTPGYRRMAGYEDWDLWMSFAERGLHGIGTDVLVYRYRREGTRMAHTALSRHTELVERLRTHHPELFAARAANWRRSRAPLMLRLALPLLHRLSLSVTHRRLLGGVVSHLAHRRGALLLVRRAREQGTGTAPGQ